MVGPDLEVISAGFDGTGFEPVDAKPLIPSDQIVQEFLIGQRLPNSVHQDRIEFYRAEEATSETHLTYNIGDSVELFGFIQDANYPDRNESTIVFQAVDFLAACLNWCGMEMHSSQLN